jgi:acyl-lipid omega-6 desaturase (Delta-12 desaturase)
VVQESGYRIMRSPLILFTSGRSSFLRSRTASGEPGAGKRERSSVIWTNIALAAVVGWIMLEIGWAAFLLVEVPVSF